MNINLLARELTEKDQIAGGGKDDLYQRQNVA